MVSPCRAYDSRQNSGWHAATYNFRKSASTSFWFNQTARPTCRSLRLCETYIDSAYGLVEDGDEIFARFLGTHQNTGEKASEYLQRLQVLITTATKRGGIDKADANKQLLRQFRCGCWDQSLILALQLRLKTETPPDFSEFLLQVRTEEDRRAAKHDHMQRHLGTTK